MKRKATLVRHMATTKMRGPWSRTKILPMYSRARMSKRARVWNMEQTPTTRNSFVKRSKFT